jgi:dephospho-CoA kinase
MIIVGLTGSIGMGKSTTSAMFLAEGIPVYDADAAVHALYAKGGAAVAPVEAAFLGVVQNGAIDRALLSAHVVGKPEALKRLEAIVHPLAGESRKAFFEEAIAKGADMVVLDIPLLFETGGERNVSAVVVVSAPADLQRERVMARPDMTAEKLDAILARQVPDAEKRARADIVIDTALGLESARDQVRAAIARLRQGPLPTRP